MRHKKETEPSTGDRNIITGLARKTKDIDVPYELSEDNLRQFKLNGLIAQEQGVESIVFSHCGRTEPKNFNDKILLMSFAYEVGSIVGSNLRLQQIKIRHFDLSDDFYLSPITSRLMTNKNIEKV